MTPESTLGEDSSGGGVVARLKFYNSVIAGAIAKAGSGRALSLYSGVGLDLIYGYQTFRTCPYNNRKLLQLKKSAERLRDFIADYLDVPSASVFPRELYSVKWPKLLERRYTTEEFVSLGKAKAELLTDGGIEVIERPRPPEEIETTIDAVLRTLRPREEKILKMRFGLDDGVEHTLEEVGQSFGVSRENIRYIEARALRKLRHPSRSRRLRPFL